MGLHAMRLLRDLTRRLKVGFVVRVPAPLRTRRGQRLRLSPPYFE